MTIEEYLNTSYHPDREFVDGQAIEPSPRCSTQTKSSILNLGMGAATLVSVEEYLSTSYSPDREYVDGRIVERNLGELTHNRIQRRLIVYFDLRSKELGIEVVPEQRVQVSPTRFRVPDVTVVKSTQIQGEIFKAPPHLCIEILSKDDTLDYMQEKIDDYLRFGVPYIWIINPRLRKGYIATKAGVVEAVLGILETSDPDIRVPIAELLDVD